ncbi:MAG: hypothetical protein ACREEB_18500 [Caulobacteraceae bacterium]
MAIVYTEPRPYGRDGERITHFTVETAGDVELHRTWTQADAIDWAKRNGHAPHVARVRHMNSKHHPDQWRAV